MSKPLISIIVLSHGEGLKYLEKTVPALLSLNYANKEIIVVDNGSTDNTVSVLAKFPEVKVVSTGANLGYTKGKNIGVFHAQGEYLLLLDNDILIENTDLLDSLVASYLDPDSALTFCLQDVGTTTTNYYGCYFNSYFLSSNKQLATEEIVNYHKEILCAYPHGGAIFVSKSLFRDKFGGYDETQEFYGDDNDFGMWLYNNNKTCRVYHQYPLLHLGVNNRVNRNYLIWRTERFFSGVSMAVIKNCTLRTIFLHYTLFCLFISLKSAKEAIKYRDLRLYGAFMRSVLFTLKQLPNTLNKRRVLQTQRLNPIDAFMRIKPPMFQND